MEEIDKIILSGAFIEFPRISNGRIYPKEVFDRECEKYLRELNIKLRKEKLNKIYGNINREKSRNKK